MLDRTLTLPDDPEELRSFTARLLAEVKAQAILIEKLRHQLAGHRAHRFGTSSETAEQLQLALETNEIAAAAMTARMKLPDIEKDKPKRRLIPDHIPRMEVELASGAHACADCDGRLRRIGEDVTEELEYAPGRFIVNRIVRPRLTCACCERFVQAPHRALPSRPIERGRPGPFSKTGLRAITPIPSAREAMRAGSGPILSFRALAILAVVLILVDGPGRFCCWSLHSRRSA